MPKYVIREVVTYRRVRRHRIDAPTRKDAWDEYDRRQDTGTPPDEIGPEEELDIVDIAIEEVDDA